MINSKKLKVRRNLVKMGSNKMVYILNNKDDNLSKVQADVVIYATGYLFDFNFIDRDILKVDDNKVFLYKNIIDPRNKNLYFIGNYYFYITIKGLCQPLGSIIPVAEIQSSKL
jgi:dimethylaniline monooxygenase (N-oxide forming)